MLGIAVQLLLSWLLLRSFDKRSLSVLGFSPTQKRLFDFGLFFFVSSLFSASTFLLRMWIAKQQYQLNPELHGMIILDGVWYNVKSVLYEELIFRGALLYILLKKLGSIKSITISAIAFGVYHWFTYNIWGNPSAMILYFVITAAMGVVLAYGYSKSNSLYIPVGIHFGWNLVQQVLFSKGPIGNFLFIEVLPAPTITISYFAYFFMQFFPVVSMLLVCFWLIRVTHKSGH